MSYFDPHENVRRIRSGLIAAVAGKAQTFDDERGLMALFCGDPHSTDQTRIVTFQKFLEAQLLARSYVGSITPGCLRIWFSFPEAGDEIRANIKKLIETEEFGKICGSLGIAQVVGGGIYRKFPQRDFSKDFVDLAHKPSLK